MQENEVKRRQLDPAQVAEVKDIETRIEAHKEGARRAYKKRSLIEALLRIKEKKLERLRRELAALQKGAGADPTNAWD